MTGFLKTNRSGVHSHSCNDSLLDDDDISIVKVDIPKKTPMKWVTSTFDDFGADFDIPKSQPKSKSKSFNQTSFKSQSQFNKSDSQSNRKRPRETTPFHKEKEILGGKPKSKLKASSMELWAEKHHPEGKADLAVHKKKVEEVEAWINQAALPRAKKQGKILLLTGPSGAGKTATIQVLCQELKLELQEWSNPIQPIHTMENTQDYWSRSRVDIGNSDSQQSKFENFVLRANKYQSLQLDGKGDNPHSNGKIILVEEFPNIYLRDPTLFHNVLRRYYRVGQSALVFIISDSSRGDSKERQLFPADLQHELCVNNISFNPVAPTMMVKVLNRICSIENRLGGFSPATSVIESIAMSSTGDIRSAINALQFACKQDTFDLNLTCKSQKSNRKTGKGSGSRLKYESSKKQDSSKTSSETELAGIGARDTSCFLFHAIGKILHCKRGDPSTYDNLPSLPSHLSHHERHPLLINPEDVVEKSQVSGDYFASFLHQNYVDFYTNIDDVVNASEYLSLIDTFSSQWSTKTALQNYATSLASRGIIHANTSNAKFDAPRSGIGWRPLHKSQWFTVQRQAKKNSETACSLFRGYHWEPEVLWTEILPNLNRMNVTMRNPAQISFIQEMGRFCQRSFQNKGEKLDEHEVVDADNEDMTSLPVTQRFDQPGDLISDSQSEIKNKTVEEEEDEKEVEIDEYFDSD